MMPNILRTTASTEQGVPHIASSLWMLCRDLNATQCKTDCKDLKLLLLSAQLILELRTELNRQSSGRQV